jgi:uncharacterized integral membrane protein (TIGR00698 family)
VALQRSASLDERRPAGPSEVHLRRVLVTSAAAGASLAISSIVPLLGPLLVALLLGMLAANLSWTRSALGHDPLRIDRVLLRSGVVVLGLKVSLSDVVDLGLPGVLVAAGTVTATFGATLLLGHALGLPKKLTALIAAGFSICGAAAIAAVESSIGARSKDVALAIALVTVFGTVMIGAVPLMGVLMGLDDTQTAIWAGASIHEVAQVVVAGSLIGGATSVALSTTVKLVRVVLLVPIQVAAARACHSEAADRRVPVVPVFLVGFLAAVVIRSTDVLPKSALDISSAVTTVLLSGAMFGLGTGIVARQLWPVPPRALVLACASTLVAATVSLALTVTLT